MELATKEWILNIYWLNEKRLTVITAHNTVILYDLESHGSLRKLQCEERCILYYATFVVTDEIKPWESLIVLCGTVFQEIIIWSPAHQTQNDKPILQRLKGHNVCNSNLFHRVSLVI